MGRRGEREMGEAAKQLFPDSLILSAKGPDSKGCRQDSWTTK
jgi:hypothetical protein